MSIFKLFVSIARETTTIATRGIKDTSSHLHSVTENKLNHIDSYLKAKNAQDTQPESIDLEARAELINSMIDDPELHITPTHVGLQELIKTHNLNGYKRWMNHSKPTSLKS